jgi:hypothetical protein
MDEAAHLLDFFFLDEFRGIEILDFARDLGIEERGIESLNAGDAGLASQQALPVLLGGVADSAQEADARNYDSAGNKEVLLPGFIVACDTSLLLNQRSPSLPHARPAALLPRRACYT